MSKKQYGLILPGQLKCKQTLQTRKLNPLANSDDELEKSDDETQPLNWVEQSLKRSAGNISQLSQQKRLLREAVEDDASVFQYDEVYDDMKEKQKESIEKKRGAIDKKPKYIHTIMKQTEKRKLEYERRIERKVQRERDEEKGEYADKESFISMSYLKKQEELEKAERAEEVEKLIEEKYDKAGRNNFFKHIFEQRLGKIDEPEVVKIEPKETIVKKKKPKNLRRQNSSSDSGDETKKHSIKEEPLSDSETTLSPKRKKKKHASGTEGSSEEEETPASIKPIDIPKVTKEDKLKKIQELLAKQTIGEKYVDAIKRYYERKANYG